MNIEADNDTPHTLPESQLIAAHLISNRVLDTLGLGPDELPDQGSPIRNAVGQLRAFAEDEAALAELEAAMEVDDGLQAYLDDPTAETFARLANSYEAFVGLSLAGEESGEKVIH